MKNKETLEEAAKRYANKIWDSSNSNEKTLHINCNKAFLKGAKWQQERSYSEEDMRLSFETGRNFQITGENNFNELIEQFKKK
jgi:hypothetical protein